MVDTERRKKLAFYLRQFSVGLTTNYAFENAISEEVADGWLPEQYYRSKSVQNGDAIILPMLELCWGLYDDTRRHRLIDAYALSPEALKTIAHCILFLHSDLEYEWPYFDVKPDVSLFDLLIFILTFGYNLKGRQKEQEQFYKQWQQFGDFSIWPFLHQSDYERQLQLQPFLKGLTTSS